MITMITDQPVVLSQLQAASLWLLNFSNLFCDCCKCSAVYTNSLESVAPTTRWRFVVDFF